jgi:protein-S-isoprenylcysteine O-methyltransferase Ste14
MLLLKNLLFTVLIPGTVSTYLPLVFVGDRSAAPEPWRAVGIVLLAVGIAVYAWCVWDFATFGRGTPAPIDAPVRLVVRGLYRITRNPMYVGVLAVTLGWAAFYATPSLVAYAAAVWTMFQSFIVFYEEPHLRATFGEEYERYCARVGRWLPRPRRSDA